MTTSRNNRTYVLNDWNQRTLTQSFFYELQDVEQNQIIAQQDQDIWIQGDDYTGTKRTKR